MSTINPPPPASNTDSRDAPDRTQLISRQHSQRAAKTLYLANAFGFSQALRTGPLVRIVDTLSSLGLTVLEPFERNHTTGHAHHIGQTNLRDLSAADGLFAIVNGCPPDPGVLVEIGIAIGLRKPLFLFRDDTRICTDNTVYPLNLMVFSGYHITSWQAAWYCDIDDLSNPDKALIRWLTNAQITDTRRPRPSLLPTSHISAAADPPPSSQ